MAAREAYSLYVERAVEGANASSWRPAINRPSARVDNRGGAWQARARRHSFTEERGPAMTGELICGIDTGGTFTDCVVMDADGRIVTAKALVHARRLLRGRHGVAAPGRASELGHHHRGAAARDRAPGAGHHRRDQRACSSGAGAKVGLITTRGHRDVIHIMRGARGVPGLNNVQVLHFPESGKPDPPIVPKPFIAEVSERVDCKGQVVVELNEEEAEAAIRQARGQGRRRRSPSAFCGRSSSPSTSGG